MNEKDYFELLKFQSISADPSKKKELEDCASWVEKKLTGIGAKVERWVHDGHPPVLFALFEAADPTAPTLLIYNHYDVQPIDPLDLWKSPPFEPTLKDEKVYARGASDNKGQLFYTLTAVEAFLKEKNPPPFNLKWVIEGEEESGSEAIHKLVKEKKKELKADGLLIVDGGMDSLKNPTLGLGVRGMITMDLKVTGPNSDLHSGIHGGIALNPIHYLVEILANARSKDGAVLIPHFYDHVKILPKVDREKFSFHFDLEEYVHLYGIPPEGGEKGAYAPKERGSIRPTLEVNGISGGYSGEGFKTVLPSFASAKVSCRLVPDQDPEETAQLIKNYFESKSKPGAKVEVHIHAGKGPAVRCSLNSPLLETAKMAVEKTFGKSPELVLEGGSIPITAELAEAALCEPLIVGVGLPTDTIHAPNENFSLEQIKLGTSFIKNFLETFDKEQKR
jgi:acetylornithine deacetylase/succinyl-diaminopimelate desuccinylase-like protein